MDALGLTACFIILFRFSQVLLDLKQSRGEGKKEVERLDAALLALGSLGNRDGRLRRVRAVKKRKPLSTAARKKIAMVQRARWAKRKAARRSK